MRAESYAILLHILQQIAWFDNASVHRDGEGVVGTDNCQQGGQTRNNKVSVCEAYMGRNWLQTHKD